MDAKKNPQIDPAVGQADNVALRGIETKTGQACILWPLAIMSKSESAPHQHSSWILGEVRKGREGGKWNRAQVLQKIDAPVPT